MMRGSAIAIVVLVVLAALATLVGGLSGDRWTDERTVRFATADVALPATELLPAGGAGANFNWTLPVNATSADLVVHLYFSGQALRGGSATVSLRFTAPDGRALAPKTVAWPLAQGATSGELEVEASAVWAEVPDRVRDTSSSAHGLHWAQPLRLQVVVESPADLPIANYDFTASATGSVATFAAR